MGKEYNPTQENAIHLSTEQSLELARERPAPSIKIVGKDLTSPYPHFLVEISKSNICEGFYWAFGDKDLDFPSNVRYLTFEARFSHQRNPFWVQISPQQLDRYCGYHRCYH